MKDGTITATATALRNGELTAKELVRRCLEAIRRHDGTLNAVLHISDTALEDAEHCDAEAARGDFRGPLHGIPLIIKDNIDVCGLPTTAASALFAKASPATSDAVVVARLRAAGAILIGKANMDEFAAHVSGRTSFFGPTVNPWHPERRLSPGGSSSGTAAAVAAGFCCGGLGTDTGGSVRLPAGWCGLCGIRPTHGQVDVSGVYPRAASLDTVGALARSVRDAELLLRTIADPLLRDALRAPSRPCSRLGVFPDLVDEKATPEVAAAYTDAIARWRELGASCVPVELPLLDDPDMVESIGIIRSYEFARDIRKDVEGNPLAGHIHSTPWADYEKGRTLPEESYLAARRHMATLARENIFAKLNVDGLLLPVAFSTAPPLDAPQEAFTAGRALVNLFSLTGVPTLVIPGNLTETGLPTGMQLVGPTLGERGLFDAGIAYEDAFGPFPLPVL